VTRRTLDRDSVNMNDLKLSISVALSSDGVIPRDSVRDWVTRAQDLETLALLYRLTDEAWDRIEPRLEPNETCAVIRSYLLRCIEEYPRDDQNDWAFTRFEAAMQLEAWFDYLADKAEDRSDILRESAAAGTDAYLRGDSEMRRTIEQAFLEHVLEQTRMRPLFEHWATHEQLREAWVAAIEWADEHPNFTKGLRAGTSDRDV
jgi:hypothetical protein